MNFLFYLTVRELLTNFSLKVCKQKIYWSFSSLHIADKLWDLCNIEEHFFVSKLWKNDSRVWSVTVCSSKWLTGTRGLEHDPESIWFKVKKKSQGFLLPAINWSLEALRIQARRRWRGWGKALAHPTFWQNNKIFLANHFNLLLWSSLCSFRQIRRKNLSKNTQYMILSEHGSFAKKEETERQVYTLGLR